MKKQLPEYLNVYGAELALLIGAFLVIKENWKMDENLGFDRHMSPCHLDFLKAKVVVLHLYSYKKVIANYSLEYMSGVVEIKSWSDFYELYSAPADITIGEYTAKVQPDGVQVGYTFVPWSTVEALLARKPKG